MPKSHRPYPPEFRQRIVELVRKGRSPEELAQQFEPSAQAIRNWVKQGALDAGQRMDGLTTEERDMADAEGLLYLTRRWLAKDTELTRQERSLFEASRAATL